MAMYAQFLDDIAAGHISPPISRVFEHEEIAEAHALMCSNGAIARWWCECGIRHSWNGMITAAFTEPPKPPGPTRRMGGVGCGWIG